MERLQPAERKVVDQGGTHGCQEAVVDLKSGGLFVTSSLQAGARQRLASHAVACPTTQCASLAVHGTGAEVRTGMFMQDMRTPFTQ